MQITLIVLPVALLMISSSCSSLPVPGAASSSGNQAAARTVLRESAASQGDAWRKYRKVEVSYSGKWSTLATKLQPVLTDPDFRKSSVEIYRPAAKSVLQFHSGPSGKKNVVRTGRNVTVSFNGKESSNPEERDAAALVADAYTIFLFGSSWLSANAEQLRMLEEREFEGERCQLVAGKFSPGLGAAAEDHFIAWIDVDDRKLRRFQFSLNGMATTQGADVDVRFYDFRKARDGSLWPTYFIEDIQRPLQVQAHEWRMDSLKLDENSVSLSPGS